MIVTVQTTYYLQALDDVSITFGVPSVVVASELHLVQLMDMLPPAHVVCHASGQLSTPAPLGFIEGKLYVLYSRTHQQVSVETISYLHSTCACGSTTRKRARCVLLMYIPTYVCTTTNG